MKNPYKTVIEVVEAIEHEFKHEPMDVLWGTAGEAFEMLEDAEAQNADPSVVEMEFLDLTGVEIEMSDAPITNKVTRKEKLSIMSDNTLDGFAVDGRFEFSVSDSLGDSDYVSCDDYAMSGGIDAG